MMDEFKIPKDKVDQILEGSEFDRTPEPIPLSSELVFFSKYGWWIVGSFFVILAWLTFKQYAK